MQQISGTGGAKIHNRRRQARKFFILGTGRSGTHWLGFILQAHPDVSILIENRLTFPLATRMALDFGKRKKLLPKLIRRYRIAHALVKPRHLADKCHPNIWLTEELADAFPRALFVGIERNPYATVASMLKHQGDRHWHETWEEFPVPNPFLGITEDNVDEYRELSLIAQCALRWKAHKEKMDALVDMLEERLHVVSYAGLIRNTAAEIEALNGFLGLSTPLVQPELINRDSFDRWQSELSQEEMHEILSITGVHCASDSRDLSPN